MGNTISNTVDDIVDTASNTVDDIVDTASNTVGDIVDTAGGLERELESDLHVFSSLTEKQPWGKRRFAANKRPLANKDQLDTKHGNDPSTPPLPFDEPTTQPLPPFDLPSPPPPLPRVPSSFTFPENLNDLIKLDKEGKLTGDDIYKMFMIFAGKGKIGMMKYLFSMHGNEIRQFGETALLNAISGGKPKTVAFLVNDLKFVPDSQVIQMAKRSKHRAKLLKALGVDTASNTRSSSSARQPQSQPQPSSSSGSSYSQPPAPEPPTRATRTRATRTRTRSVQAGSAKDLWDLVWFFADLQGDEATKTLLESMSEGATRFSNQNFVNGAASYAIFTSRVTRLLEGAPQETISEVKQLTSRLNKVPMWFKAASNTRNRVLRANLDNTKARGTKNLLLYNLHGQILCIPVEDINPELSIASFFSVENSPYLKTGKKPIWKRRPQQQQQQRQQQPSYAPGNVSYIPRQEAPVPPRVRNVQQPRKRPSRAKKSTPITTSSLAEEIQKHYKDRSDPMSFWNIADRIRNNRKIHDKVGAVQRVLLNIEKELLEKSHKFDANDPFLFLVIDAIEEYQKAREAFMEEFKNKMGTSSYAPTGANRPRIRKKQQAGASSIAKRFIEQIRRYYTNTSSPTFFGNIATGILNTRSNEDKLSAFKLKLESIGIELNTKAEEISVKYPDYFMQLTEELERWNVAKDQAIQAFEAKLANRGV